MCNGLLQIVVGRFLQLLDHQGGPAATCGRDVLHSHDVALRAGEISDSSARLIVAREVYIALAQVLNDFLKLAGTGLLHLLQRYISLFVFEEIL